MFKSVIIASGPTIEPIDPVRFISNRSSGKTGFHLANEAKKRKIDEIFFITGPTNYIPSDVNLVHVDTAISMRDNMLTYFKEAEVIIMAAAVSDYRSSEYCHEKIKKGNDRVILELVKNPDILKEIGEKKSDNQILVGFAAETSNIFENAKEKFEKKNLDLLVLNEISKENPVFNEDFNQVFFVYKKGIIKLDKMSKMEIAVLIWDEIFKIAEQTKVKNR